ncbi:sulfatase [Lujinxingia litoralis]|uniref:Sulfatase n=1 Tax=Lujinxingia litoralis TaxID=2211119 RepID=A0A328C7Y2_9DELT|nr:sulfatase-like hydrolase/transferase [Lujinxingia litoralis]RAL21758.1 sulfatase [Lujinxingia litoralis]
MLLHYRDRLSAVQQRFLHTLGLPLFLFMVVLKALRVSERAEVAGILGALDLFKSEVFLGAAFVALGFGLLRPSLGPAARRLAWVGLSLTGALIAGVEVVAHHFYMTTGSALDASLVRFSLQHFGETWTVVSSEVPLQTLGLLSVALLYFGGGHALLARVLRRVPAAPADAPRVRTLSAGATLVLAMALGALALTPPMAEPYAPFARASILHLTTSALDLADESDIDIVARAPLHQASLKPTGADAPRHVALIVLESTRARSLSVYNPELDTTPFLSQLAEESLVAERAYAVVPHTSKALVATLCGIEPRLTMPITEALPGAIPARCLADLLNEQGFESAFFQAATEHFEGRRQLVANMGYQHFKPVNEMRTRGFEKANYFGYEDDIMLEPGRSWLKGRRGARTFTTFLTLTPHHDYLAPERYGHHDFDPDEELNDYHNTIRYVDHFVANVMAQYKELGLYEDTLFVIVGDHGEGFGEHGRRQHDNVIYEEGLHIPMMLFAPGQPELARRLDTPVSQVDLLPTIAALLGFELHGDYPGFDLREAPTERTLFAHCWYERRCMASIRGDDKYVHHFGSQPDERFDLGTDPLERQSTLRQSTDNDLRVRELRSWRASVNRWHEEHSLSLMEGKILDAMPPLDHPVDLRFGDVARLRGYSISEDELRPGHSVTVTYVFEALKPIPEGWLLFVHGNGPHKTRNLDHVPVRGLYPLHRWQPGEFIVDEHTFHIPRDWRPGDFHLRLGIYHPDHGRLELSGDVPLTDDRRATLFTLPIVR